jgi:hypothetical protein
MAAVGARVQRLSHFPKGSAGAVAKWLAKLSAGVVLLLYFIFVRSKMG